MSQCTLFGRLHHHRCDECDTNVVDPSRLSHADKQRSGVSDVQEPDRGEGDDAEGDEELS